MLERLPERLVERLSQRLAQELGRQAVALEEGTLVVRPADEAAVATALRLIAATPEAAAGGLGIRGRGSKAGWGDPPADVALILDTSALRSGLRHDADDLVASAPAGLGWAELQDQLASAGQWVPLDPPLAAAASVGGVTAAATSGPRRLASGGVRDLVIGARAVLPDGRVIQAGGRVIKNVAGYDLCKLLVGSFGSLAAITEVTFKVTPLPESRGWIEAAFADLAEAHARALAVLASVLQPSAVQILWRDGRPSVRVDLDGVEAVVARQLRDLAQLLGRGSLGRGGPAAAGTAGPAGGEAPALHAEGPLAVGGPRDLLAAVESAAPGPGSAVVRIGVPAARLIQAHARAEAHLGPLGGQPLRADVAAGLLWWTLPPAAGQLSPAAWAGAIHALGTELRAWGGYAALEAGPTAVHRELAARPGDELRLSRRVKAVFDPQGLLRSARPGL